MPLSPPVSHLNYKNTHYIILSVLLSFIIIIEKFSSSPLQPWWNLIKNFRMFHPLISRSYSCSHSQFTVFVFIFSSSSSWPHQPQLIRTVKKSQTERSFQLKLSSQEDSNVGNEKSSRSFWVSENFTSKEFHSRLDDSSSLRFLIVRMRSNIRWTRRREVTKNSTININKTYKWKGEN